MVSDPGQEHSSDGHGPTEKKKGGKQARPRAAYQPWSADFGFIPQMQPLPLPEAIRLLPRRYRFVLSKPGFEPFLAEMGLAEWKVVWFQLLVYSAVAAGLTFLRTVLYPASTNAPNSASGLSSPAIASILNLVSSLGLLVLIPLGFFFAMGLLYWLARAFGGHGIFVQQAYTTLLFLVPCGIFASLLGLIPFVGGFLSAFLGFVLFIYAVALQCFATTVVHQMSGGKATAAVIITLFISILAIIACLILVFIAI